MAIIPPINFKKWIDENRHLLKPPVGNQVVYKDTEFIIMVVGGPNARKDFHFNKGEEFFYQIEGDIQLPIRENGKTRVIDIKEGEIFLLPAGVEHSPQRFPNTIGLVIERVRTDEEMDQCSWYCESCDELLHKATFHCNDIVAQLPVLMNSFYNDEKLRTCKHCGTVMEIPTLKQ
ncbi:MAG: 3-hydroxyanthranilate 3,4-dioxygenase [Saprospiraceae bacterium]|nr:3-hydroxyanthranilate 3,4-dioxygenase [Saprospiraceae bacterium]